jgi:type III pantothenate kinase
MLLTIDIGNTNFTLGVFKGETLAHIWRLATLRERTSDEIGLFVTQAMAQQGLDVAGLAGVIISSVVPPLTAPTALAVEEYCGKRPVLIENGLNIGMPVLYDKPSDVGADRVVNAVAAYDMYGRAWHRPLIIVDFGTATTFDAVSAAGEYLGGILCPGIGISADALFQRTAKLPRVDVRKPARLIGRATVESIQSGLFFGYVAMVEGLVDRMRIELLKDEPQRVVCIATGGLAPVIAEETRVIQYSHPDLTLQGLRLIWERQHQRVGVGSIGAITTGPMGLTTRDESR